MVVGVASRSRSRTEPSGWVDDGFAFLWPFGFDVAAISVPLLIVHGVQDQFVPVDHGRWLAGAITGAEAWIDDDDGHLSLIVNRVGDVHDWLLSHFSRANHRSSRRQRATTRSPANRAIASRSPIATRAQLNHPLALAVGLEPCR